VAENATSHAQIQLRDPAKQEKPFGFSTPLLYAAGVALLAALHQWPRRWLVSGASILTLLVLLGSAKGYRVLLFMPLWTLIATLNLVFAIA
jgi:hypothetical protein